MKNTLKILSGTAALLAAVQLSAHDYRIPGAGGDASDWNNAANWSNAEGSLDPASTPPNGNGTVYFLDEAKGTSTILKTSDDPAQKGSFAFSNSSDIIMRFGSLQIENTAVTGLFRIYIGDYANGSESERNNSAMIISNSDMSVQQLYMSAKSYSDSTLILKGNSTLTVTGGSWNNIAFAGGGNSSATFTIEKGSSFTTLNANINKQGAGTLVMNIAGTVNIGSSGSGEAELNNDSVFHVYGSAQVTVAQRTILKNSASMVFHTAGIDAGRMATFSDGSIGGNATAIWTTGARDGKSFDLQNSSGITIDLSDFSVEGSSFVEGETYALFLISAASYEVDLGRISLSGSLDGNSGWELAGETADEYLRQVQNGDSYGVYLLLNYTAVPEPGFCAAAFGVLALAAAALRRK